MIITLGEVIVGTVTAVSAAVEEHGWTLEAVAVAAAGTLLAFGMLAVLYDALVRRVHGLHLLMFVGAVVVMALAVVVSLFGVGVGVTLLITSLAPLVLVVGYEAGGHRKAAADLLRLDV